MGAGGDVAEAQESFCYSISVSPHSFSNVRQRLQNQKQDLTVNTTAHKATAETYAARSVSRLDPSTFTRSNPTPLRRPVDRRRRSVIYWLAALMLHFNISLIQQEFKSGSLQFSSHFRYSSTLSNPPSLMHILLPVSPCSKDESSTKTRILQLAAASIPIGGTVTFLNHRSFSVVCFSHG